MVRVVEQPVDESFCSLVVLPVCPCADRFIRHVASDEAGSDELVERDGALLAIDGEADSGQRDEQPADQVEGDGDGVEEFEHQKTNPR